MSKRGKLLFLCANLGSNAMGNDSKSKGKRPSEQFMDEVAAAYGTKYDDRDSEAGEGRPYLHELAKEFKTSTVRIRKILITKGLYSTEVTREVERLLSNGYKVSEISEMMNLKQAAVCAAMPYGKGIYNIDPKTAVGERAYRTRCRKAGINKLQKCIEKLNNDDKRDMASCIEELWNCITLFQGYWFKTSGRNGNGAVSFAYSIKKSSRTGNLTDEIIINRKENSKSITRSTVELAFKNAIRIMDEEGYVKGPKKLGCFGASYLYSIFIRFGIITDKREGEDIIES